MTTFQNQGLFLLVIFIVRIFVGKSTSEPVVNPTTIIVEQVTQLGDPMIIRLAGISGALAVMTTAYAAHGFGADREKDRSIFQTGAYQHLVHSSALLAAPLARRPYLTASLFVTGITLFSGTCYYVAVTKDERFAKLAPIGGMSLILAWASFAL